MRSVLSNSLIVFLVAGGCGSVALSQSAQSNGVNYPAKILPGQHNDETSYVMIDAPSAIAMREATPLSVDAAPEPKAIMVAPVPKRLGLQNEFQRNTECENGILRGKPCRVSWVRVLSESFFFLSAQHAGNIGMDHDTRVELGLLHPHAQIVEENIESFDRIDRKSTRLNSSHRSLSRMPSSA